MIQERRNLLTIVSYRLMIFKQYTLNGKRCVSNAKRHVIQRKQTGENVCGLCLNANTVRPVVCWFRKISRRNSPVTLPQ